MTVLSSIKRSHKIILFTALLIILMAGLSTVFAGTAPNNATYNIEGGGAAMCYYDDHSFDPTRQFAFWPYRIDGGVAYCVNYGNFAYWNGSGSGANYGAHKISNLDAVGTSVLVHGYGGPRNILPALGYGYLSPYEQEYATQVAVFLVSSQNAHEFNIGNLSLSYGAGNAQAVLDAGNALANHARNNPVNSNDASGNAWVNISGGGEDITSKTKIIDNGANVVIGPFTISTYNCGNNDIEASITNGVPASFCDANGNGRGSTYRNGESIYLKISTTYTGKASINVKVRTTAESGYNAAIYRLDRWDHEMQDFARLYDATSYPEKEISIPLDNLPRRELYIRHVNNKTQEQIPCNNSEKELINGDANNFVVRNNLGSRSPVYTSGGASHPINYQEYYRYGAKNLMQVSRSLVYCQTINGKVYRYIYTGGAKAVGSTFQEAYTNFTRPTDDVWTSKSLTVNTGPLYRNAADVTVMEFYYNVYTDDGGGDDGGNTPDPGIEVEPDPGSGNGSKDSSTTDDCSTTYTPSGKQIKPYLITSKYYARDIKYELQADGKYHLTALNVNMLQSGEAVNGPKQNEITGTIIGNDYTTLFNGGGNAVTLNISTSLANELQELKNKLSTVTAPLNDLKDVEANFGASDFISKAIRAKTIFYPNSDAPDQITHRNITDRIKTKAQGESQTGGYGEKVTKTGDFNSWQLVPKEKYNGLRMVNGNANYVTYNALNGQTGGTTKVATKNKKYVNVYTPVTVGEVHVKSDGIVDQTVGNKGSDTIQRNAPFTLTIGRSPNSTLYGKPTREYLSHYYVIFGMDVIYKGGKVNKGTPIRIDGASIKADGSVEITDFKATDADTTGTGTEFIQSISNKISVVGVAYNAPDRVNTPDTLEAEVLAQEDRYMTIEGTYKYIGKPGTGGNWPTEFGGIQDVCAVDFSKANNRKQSHNTFGGNSSKYGGAFKTMIYDAYYFARNQTYTSNIGRLYDFQITDCSDVNFKNVFRKGTGTSVNDLTNIIYFSGTKELKIYGSGVNDIKPRTNINIPGTSSQTVFPLGPYKHTQANYLQAPKMGYRISFNVKTTGYYTPSNNANDPKRRVIIKPTYYYLSKDGSKMTDNITLYYKDSNGKYKKFANSNYKITFKPNDGYRNLYNSPRGANDVTDYLSTQLQELNLSNSTAIYDGTGNSSGWFELNDNMVTLGNNNYIQAWYGEFKLPNSTIAVEQGKSVNNPLTNGYVGVRFEVRCVDTTTDTSKVGNTISYNQNDKNASGQNTTQWDYEGFMGFNTPGTELKTSNNNNLRLQVENGIWNIDTQAQYDIAKSTVVFFDLDNRAADDFQ